jgi:MHS family proline/betaine transporter-like MFS transporter
MSNSEVIAAPVSDVFGLKRRHLVIAATIGNLFEWYDFISYGVLAITMAKLFFPAESEFTSLFLSLVTYGGGVAMRPVGAIVLGRYADRVGRKAALCLAMSIMGIGTGLMAVAPTYETIGVWAPLLIVFARLLQGFSGSGQLGNATALLAESAPDRWRGLYASLNASSQQIGFVLAAFIVMVINLSMTPAQIEAGGWRLPFVFGLVIVPVAIYVRFKLEDPEVFLKKRNEPIAASAATTLGREGRPLLLAFGILVLYVVSGNVHFVYMPTFAVQKLGLPSAGALFATVVTTCVSIVGTPLVAALSDRFGRKPILLLATLSYLLLTYPMFAIITTWPSVTLLTIVQSGLGFLNALYAGPLMSALAELFRTSVRATAVALAYSLTTIIGGFSPAFATWLVAATGDARAPALIVIAAAIVSGFALLRFTDRFREPLA